MSEQSGRPAASRFVRFPPRRAPFARPRADSGPGRRRAPTLSKRSVVRAGQPYHLLGRHSSYRWWRPLLGLGLFTVAAVLVLVIGTGVLLLLVDPPMSSGGGGGGAGGGAADSPGTLLLTYLVHVGLLLAVWFAVRWADNRPFRSISSVAGGLRWRWLGDCQLVALAVLAPAFALDIGYGVWHGDFGGAFPGWAVYARLAAIAVLIVPLQSAAEEYVFRGFLPQTITAWFRTPWVGIGVSSLLFLLGHGYTDPLAWTLVALMAVSMCWLTVRTGGLEAAIALHVTNNVVGLLVDGATGGPHLGQAGDVAWGNVIPFLVAVPVYTWLVDRRGARRGVETVIGGRLTITPLTLRIATGAPPR